MKTFVFSILLLFLFSISAFAQNPTPTATPPDDENILKISTTLIQVDVTVTDKKGNVVTDLTPKDFEVYENGKRQEIRNFSFVSVNPQTKRLENTQQPKSADWRNQIPIPSVKLKPEQVRRTYAIVVDDLGISFDSAYWVRQALKKFINEQVEEGDLVAILRTGIGIGALQSFTSDKRLLLAAADKIRWNPRSRTSINTFDPIRSMEGDGKDDELWKQMEEFRYNSISVGTFGALNYIIRGLRGMPGRKSLLLISHGWHNSTETFDQLRGLADLANRSSVVVYTLDPRGLQNPSMAFAEDDLTSVVPDNPGAGGIESDPRETRDRTFRETQMSLRYLAYETSGVSFVNQNNLGKGLLKAVNDQNSYYLLGYQPDEDTFNPKKNKFNKLEVKVTRPGVKIRYRSGFFAISDEKYRQTPKTPQHQLGAALVSPFGASEINLELYSIFYNDNQNRSFIRSLVYIEPDDLTFTPGADGLYRAKFDAIAMIFDANGAAAGNHINSHELKFTREQLAKIREKGMIYDLPVPIVKTGAYQFRVAIRDSTSGKIGAASQFIEVPDLKKNKLTLSNLVLHNFTPQEWRKISLGQTRGAISGGSALLDTALRRFNRGTTLLYNYVIYNAKADRTQKPHLQIQARLIREGKVIFEDRPTPFDAGVQTDLQRLQASGAVTFGSELAPGDYILQVIVFDNANDGKQKLATQFVEFEIVK